MFLFCQSTEPIAFLPILLTLPQSLLNLPIICDYRKSSIKPPGGLIFSKHFWGGGLIESGGLLTFLLWKGGAY